MFRAILQPKLDKILDDFTLTKYVLINCEKAKTMTYDRFLSPSKKEKSEPLQMCFFIRVNRARDKMSLRTGPGQIYGPPDVADLQPLFNLQIPAT